MLSPKTVIRYLALHFIIGLNLLILSFLN